MSAAFPKIHWLVDAAMRQRPDVIFPEGVEVAADLGEAWLQVSAVFNLQPIELADCVAKQFGLKVGDLRRFQPNDGSVLQERLCREMGVVPLWHSQSSVCVAAADPRLTQEQLNMLRFAAGHPIELTVLPPDDIDTCLTRLFAGPRRSGDKTNVIDLGAVSRSSEDAHVVKLARAIFQAAIDKNASDVHIHPFVGGGAIRFRIDGMLRRIATLPMETLDGLSRYLQANAGLGANPLKPQDGRLRLKYGHREIDLRLSILPAYDGDRIVCRLLDQSRNFSLQNSRFSPADNQALRQMTANSAGIVLLTGPTGSGKTSTLYALLTELNRVDVNIMTIEDPVEYVLPGISQVQVNERQGLSFADTLRSILRQDPDIILVGEIRDGETARIAAQAALTGHLVLSTLHTNDALATVPRLLDLGLGPSTLADALIGVVSQRLVRRLCEHCRQPAQTPYQAGEEEFLRIVGEAPTHRPVGCEQCQFTGYRGRLPIIERLEVSAEMRQALLAGTKSTEELAKHIQGFHHSMAASARDWIVSGQTTTLEVQRVLGMRFWNDLAKEHGVAPGNLSAASSVEGRTAGRLKILLISRDEALAAQLGTGLVYAVERDDDEVQAKVRLEQDAGVIALVIDTRVLASTPVESLTRLREQLAWSGLPALFITDDTDAELIAVLNRFGAKVLDRSQASAESLSTTLMQLLQHH